MKTLAKVMTVVLLAVMGMATNGWAQGSLTPPGAPATTMKTLEEIWNQIGAAQSQIAQLQNQLAAVSNRVTTLTAAQFPSVAAPLTMVVDTNAPVGTYSLLAFAPSGNAGISYRDESSGRLKYAEITQAP